MTKPLQRKIPIESIIIVNVYAPKPLTEAEIEEVILRTEIWLNSLMLHDFEEMDAAVALRVHMQKPSERTWYQKLKDCFVERSEQ